MKEEIDKDIQRIQFLLSEGIPFKEAIRIFSEIEKGSNLLKSLINYYEKIENIRNVNANQNG